ncbi:MAG: putative RND superfamily exporter protein [Planctomycetota bacterium]|jgi:predicted RND superfamily exporter protein
MKPLKLYNATVLALPKTVVLCLAILFGVCGYWIKDFQLDASSDSLVLEGDDDLRFARSMDTRYGGDEFVIVTYSPTGDLFGPESLENLKLLRDEFQQLERVSSVTTLLDVPLLRNPPVPLPEVQANLKTLEHDDVDIELAREEFATSPVYTNLIVNADLTTTAMQITFKLDPAHEALSDERQALIEKRLERSLTADEDLELQAVQSRYAQSKSRLRDERHVDIATIRSIIDRYRDKASLFLGGLPMIVDDIVAFIKADLSVFGVGMMLLLIVTLGIIFRRARWIILPLLCCGASGLVMMGLLGLIGWEVTVVSSNFVSLQLIFTMSLTIHLIVRYRELLRERPDDDNRTLILDAVGHTFVPCLYASLTTVAGFTSLILCDILPVVTFGWMMTMGIGVSLVVTFVLFPAALFLMPKPPAAEEREFGLTLINFFARLAERRGTLVLVVSAIVGGLTILGATRLEVENSFINYFKQSTEIYRGMEFIDRELGGTTPLDIILNFETEADEETADGIDSDADDGFDEFDDFAFEEDEADAEKYWFTTTKLERIAKVHDYLESLPASGKVSSLATLTDIGREINDGEPLDDFLLAILFQKMPDDFKTALVNPYASIGNEQARINVRIKDSLKSLRRDALLKKVKADLKDELGLKEDQFRVSGLMVLYNNMLQSLFQSQIKTIGYTVLALTVMFLLLFRSIKISIIAILPSLLASLVVIGVMGLGGIPLDVMTITIVAISIGIAVDDTIHYLHRFRVEFEKDRSYVQTMHRCHRSIGSAMFYTSITITSGFSILALSNFVPSILFGLLTALAMLMALISALTLLPKLILMMKPFGSEA